MMKHRFKVDLGLHSIYSQLYFITKSDMTCQAEIMKHRFKTVL